MPESKDLKIDISVDASKAIRQIGEARAMLPTSNRQILIEVLENIDIPHIERELTDEEAGASIKVVSQNDDGLTTIEASTSGWIEVSTMWSEYADQIMLGLLARGLELRKREP
jgi:hypothetical protein